DVKRIGVVLLAVTLVAGVVGCFTPFRMQYRLILSSTEGGQVATPGEGTFAYWGGTVVNLVAEADESYCFINWTGDACACNIGDINAASTSITINNDYSIIANFEELPAVQHQLAINSTEGGNVTTPGVGVFTYNEGTVVNLVAEADEDYQFVEWTGNVSTIADVNATATNITMNGSYNITAKFGSVYGDYSDLLNYVIVSPEETVLKPGTEVYPSEGEHAPLEYYSGPWPTAEELIDFYLEEVEDEESYGSDLLTLDSDMELGPFYRDGELEIKAGTAGVTLTLTGTTYVSGDTLVGSTGKDFTLNLNDHTIFVASNSSDPKKALWIGGKCTVVGSGVIITIGDMYFEPNTEAGVTDPIFVMSVSGTTNVQPGGDFYGCIAGSVEID
ncbi:MAG: hypothetical protein KAQ73_00400, partial [Dehalococcoidia bacterium]|nr:hypothetical protein [Dehalococcoidia bacterium]